MTLIEIMVVVAIIGLIMGGVGLTAYKQWQLAQRKTARNDVRSLVAVVEAHRVQHQGRCPPSSAALTQSGLTRDIRHDPWGNEFQFECESGSVLARSAGPDGQHDTDDDFRSDATQNSGSE